MSPLPPDAPPASAGTDPRLRHAIRAVAWVGVGFTLTALALFGVRAALGVAAGALVASANLLALAKVVGALLPGDADGAERQSRAGWALVAALKMAALFVVCWVLLRHVAVPPMALLAGFGALPVGIAIGSLVSDRRGA